MLIQNITSIVQQESLFGRTLKSNQEAFMIRQSDLRRNLDCDPHVGGDLYPSLGYLVHGLELEHGCGNLGRDLGLSLGDLVHGLGDLVHGLGDLNLSRGYLGLSLGYIHPSLGPWSW